MTENDPRGDEDAGTDGTEYAALRRDGVLRVRRPATEWLSTGWNGGRRTVDCAYSISVPDGWARTDLAAYVDERLERAGFDGTDGGDGDPPVLLTGVDMVDVRGARCGPVTVYATAGLSNPAALPMDPGESADTAKVAAAGDGAPPSPESTGGSNPGPGTVNLVVGTTRALAPGALANLIAVAAEAKAATLLAAAGVPGTTTDAVVVGHDPTGRPAEFSGSGTEVGAATRACVREAVRAALGAHYEGRDASLPESVETASEGVSTGVRADVFRVSDPREPDQD